MCHVLLEWPLKRVADVCMRECKCNSRMCVGLCAHLCVNVCTRVSVSASVSVCVRMSCVSGLLMYAASEMFLNVHAKVIL